MAQELIYTSAPMGLRGGSGGFCTVAYTKNMSLTLVQMLESLSAYKPAFALHDVQADKNPIAYSHYLFTIQLHSYSILSRIAPTLADHTQRDNKLAHHVVLSRRELSEVGPLGVMLDDDFFVKDWNEEPHYLNERVISSGQVDEQNLAITWQEVAGDAGWAGVMARHSLERPRVPVFVIYKAGMPMDLLFYEAMRLLPKEQRWRITFNTYFCYLPAGATCLWRGCLEGSSAANEARRQPQGLVIDLTRPLPELTEKNPFIECARGHHAVFSAKEEKKNPANRTTRLPYVGSGYGSRPSGGFSKPMNLRPKSESETKEGFGFLQRWKEH